MSISRRAAWRVGGRNGVASFTFVTQSAKIAAKKTSSTS